MGGLEEVTRPKEHEGLGLQMAKGRNTTLLAKLNWRFHSEKTAPWARVLRLKYCNHQRVNLRNENRLSSSRIWKGLKKGEGTFRKGVRWIQGSDSNLDFWQDNWSALGPFRQSIQGPLTRESLHLKIKDVGHSGG